MTPPSSGCLLPSTSEQTPGSPGLIGGGAQGMPGLQSRILLSGAPGLAGSVRSSGVETRLAVWDAMRRARHLSARNAPQGPPAVERPAAFLCERPETKGEGRRHALDPYPGKQPVLRSRRDGAPVRRPDHDLHPRVATRRLVRGGQGQGPAADDGREVSGAAHQHPAVPIHLRVPDPRRARPVCPAGRRDSLLGRAASRPPLVPGDQSRGPDPARRARRVRDHCRVHRSARLPGAGVLRLFPSL